MKIQDDVLISFFKDLDNLSWSNEDFHGWTCNQYPVNQYHIHNLHFPNYFSIY